MRRPPMMRPLTGRFAGPWPLRSPPLVGWWGTPTMVLYQDPPVGFLGSLPRHQLGPMRCGSGMRW
jgi:hypothetical protein